jgi:circadian clock protein KaiB
MKLAKPTRAKAGKRRKAPKPPRAPRGYLLRLYVTGATAKSVRAITNIKRICEKHLAGQYALEVIDVYQRPNLAREEQIIAAPTLVKCLPLPLKRWIGDLTDNECVLAGLEVRPKEI